MLVQSLHSMQGRMRHTIELVILACAGILGSVTLVACSGGGGGGGGAAGGGGNPAPSTGTDLMPLSIDFDPPGIEAGGTLTVSDTVRNDGTEMSPPFSVSIYLSDDAVIDAGDTLLGFRSIAALAPGQESTGGGSVTIPLGTTDGKWWIGTYVDDFAQVTESDETNNALETPGTLTVQEAMLANVHPTEVTLVQTSIEAGEAIDVTDTVTNDGTAVATDFVVGIYLSPDAVITTSDTLLGVRAIPALVPGAESTATGSMTVPASTTPGSWYVGVIADTQSDLIETNEFDNSAVAPTLLTIEAPPLPDVAVTQFSFSPVSVNVGFPIDVTESVANQGLGAAGPFEVGIYLSTDSIIATTDILVGSRTITSLGVGQESTQSAPVTIPSDTPEGVYHVGAIADSESDLFELAEANNALASLGFLTVVVPPMPNLEMTGISFNPSIVNAGVGETLTITDTVMNSGVMPTGTFHVGFYLSNNSAISSSDILLGTRAVTALAVGESSTGISDLVIPQNISGGSYFVGALADADGVVNEAVTGDNSIFAGGTLDVVSVADPMPDLVMENLSYSPHSLTPGATLNLLDAVRNQGDLSAGMFHVGVYLSDDEDVTTDDMLLTERVVFNLSIDFGSASSFQTLIPDTLPVGTYHIGAIADHNAVVAEHDEDNNLLVSVGTLDVFVPPPPMPDLIVSSLAFTPDTASSDVVIEISDTVENDGNLDASGSFRLSYYLSEDDEITADDTFIGSRNVTDLPAGQESGSTLDITLPSGLDPGTYTVGAIVDDLEAVDESDEENNTFEATGTLEIL